MPVPLNLIVAATEAGGIGIEGQLPWRLKADMNYFMRVTKYLQSGQFPYASNFSPIDNAPRNVVIMGRKTWESIPKKFRPMAGRLNIVLSTQADFVKSVETESTEEAPVLGHTSLQSAVSAIASIKTGSVFIIGGGSLYKEAISHPWCENIFLTKVYPQQPVECDTFFPELPPTQFQRVKDEDLSKRVGDTLPVGRQKEGDFEYEFQLYVRSH
ncbi:dihydrofolate reductase [Rhizophlyctis rosea]|uniref:Dihydrofolate reductase n=1 Tax=Rhizophlyctis rosea TaxID=64517 RepID=A0AAD5SBY6_9FUNG|nr:dihydrofolate reductase [Rhizophlyctis rosea]